MGLVVLESLLLGCLHLLDFWSLPPIVGSSRLEESQSTPPESFQPRGSRLRMVQTMLIPQSSVGIRNTLQERSFRKVLNLQSLVRHKMPHGSCRFINGPQAALFDFRRQPGFTITTKPPIWPRYAVGVKPSKLMQNTAANGKIQAPY